MTPDSRELLVSLWVRELTYQTVTVVLIFITHQAFDLWIYSELLLDILFPSTCYTHGRSYDVLRHILMPPKKIKGQCTFLRVLLNSYILIHRKSSKKH